MEAHQCLEAVRLFREALRALQLSFRSESDKTCLSERCSFIDGIQITLSNIEHGKRSRIIDESSKGKSVRHSDNWQPEASLDDLARKGTMELFCFFIEPSILTASDGVEICAAMVLYNIAVLNHS